MTDLRYEIRAATINHPFHCSINLFNYKLSENIVINALQLTVTSSNVLFDLIDSQKHKDILFVIMYDTEKLGTLTLKKL